MKEISVSKEPVEVDVDTFAQLLLDQSRQRLARILGAQAAGLFVVALAIAGRHQDYVAMNNWAIVLVGVATFALVLAALTVVDRFHSTEIVVRSDASRSRSIEGRP